MREQLDDEDGEFRPREGEARALATLGYTHDIALRPYFLFHHGGWQEVTKGFDPKFAADTLIARGLMLQEKDGRRTRRRRIGSTAPRFFTVDAALLDYDAMTPVGEQGEPTALPPDPAPVSEDYDDLSWPDID